MCGRYGAFVVWNDSSGDLFVSHVAEAMIMGSNWRVLLRKRGLNLQSGVGVGCEEGGFVCGEECTFKLARWYPSRADV